MDVTQVFNNSMLYTVAYSKFFNLYIRICIRPFTIIESIYNSRTNTVYETIKEDIIESLPLCYPRFDALLAVLHPYTV